MKMYNYLLIGIILVLISNVKTDAVCDLATLIVELKQDLADNGMLDCLRQIDPPHFVEETEHQKNLRIAAQWDTSCSFESSSNWAQVLKSVHDIPYLVDSVGERVEKDFENQADMCEIVRAVVAQNKFLIKDLNMQKLPDDFIDMIDCVGLADPERKGPRICAVTGGSFFQQDSWTILLDTVNMKFSGKPEFIIADEKDHVIENPIKNPSNPTQQAKLIKDLMKFSKDQLDLKQGELANMINKSEKEEGNPDKSDLEKDVENEKTSHATTHVKRINEATYPKGDKYTLIEGASNSFTMEQSRIVFAFYMATAKFEKPGNIYFKLKYANREIPESRQAIGDLKIGTTSAAFAEVYNPKEKEKIDIELFAESSEQGTVYSKGGDENLSFGVVTLPMGSVYKKVNSANLEFHKSEIWNPLTNFDLSVKNTGKEPSFYMIIYNLAFPLKDEANLETRLVINKREIVETSVNAGPTKLVGINCATVVRLQPNATINASLKYKFSGQAHVIDDFTNPHFVQSYSAFQLPKSADVKNYKLDKPFSLETHDDWISFNLDAKIDINKPKTVIIIYNVNLKVENGTFSSRIRIDNKYNKKSVFKTTGQTFANAQGYVSMTLKPGKYSFDIDFKSDSKNTFNPENSALDGQVVSMQLILLD